MKSAVLSKYEQVTCLKLVSLYFRVNCVFFETFSPFFSRVFQVFLTLWVKRKESFLLFYCERRFALKGSHRLQNLLSDAAKKMFLTLNKSVQKIKNTFL